jgi:Ca-activated chloride channel family protein
MVRVQAPDQPEVAKATIVPKRLALVVDRSGSMDGQPLTEALRCVEHIAKCMTPKDSLSVVVYDDKVDVLVPLAPMKSSEAVRRAIAGVSSGGSTDLFAGWQQGATELEKGLEGSISRVILLSDGQANHGLVEPAAIEKHCRDWLEKGVSTTTVGLGRGFNEELMIAMARSGGGQQYYGQTAEDLYDNFDEELSLLQAMYLRALDLKLIPAPGVVVEPLGIFQQNLDGSYRLSDLAWGAEAWFMVRLHVSPSAPGQMRELLAASVQGHTLEGQILSAHAPLLVLEALEAQALLTSPADAMVQRRLLEVEFAQASLALRQLVQKGDARGAKALMKEMERRFGEEPWLKDKMLRLRELAERDEELMSKEIRYSSMKMSTRLAQRDETLYAVDETTSAMPAYLRKKAEEGRGRKKPGK